MGRATVVRTAVFLATVFAAWAVLSLGSGADTPELEVGQPSPQRFEAARTARVEDEAETERLRQEARDGVPAPRQLDAEVDASVLSNVQGVFEDLEMLVMGDPPEGTLTPIPSLPEEEETTTTTVAGEDTTEDELPVEPAVLQGVVFIDVDDDGVFSPEAEGARVDQGISGVSVEVITHSETYSVRTDREGVWSVQYPGGPAVAVVDVNDPGIPEGYFLSTDNLGQLVECEAGQTCELDDVGFAVSLRPASDLNDEIATQHNLLPDTALFLAEVAADDVIRAALGEPLHLPSIQSEAIREASVRLAGGIMPEDLQAVRVNVRANPPRVVFDGQVDDRGSEAANEVVAANLQANLRINDAQWEEEREAAADAVEPAEVEYAEDTLIVDAGVPLEPLHIAAINATRAPSVEEQPSPGLLAVIAVLVTLLGVYLAVFRPEFWNRPRMLALLGILVVLAAGAVRATVAVDIAFVAMPGQVGWYVLPAVAFGFITAVLFDQRIAILMALAVGVLTAVGTLDTGVTVYAMLAALAPIPFVSKVSTRGAFRNAVVTSSLVAAGVAAATSWFFHVGPNETVMEVVPIAVAWAFGVSVLASLLGLAALQYFELAFDITTTLSLLDLTDRNHQALQMLQEKAFGTFNHSLMVGTLAHAAARAIGADPLLARAMAYYHDLGKTENPMFFIENQFGMSNPHDDLDPRESARIIRDHVSTGLALAREYKIPTEVSEGIVSHHGDGVMRYFYEKARQTDGDQVDIDDFRHIGHKPRTQETAILMLADSLEAACRAEFQAQGQETSPDAIEKVVNRVIDEKMEDGQFSEAPLTLGEITKVRLALLDSLIGHYHQRIPYPNFPGK
jgi:cyclic-di-AMP phosphodiesterase PgpH